MRLLEPAELLAVRAVGHHGMQVALDGREDQAVDAVEQFVGALELTDLLRGRVDELPFHAEQCIEIAFGLYMSCCIWISLWYGFGRGSVPFLVIFAGGYFYVGFSSLYVLWRMQQEAEDQVTDAEPEALVG